MKHKELDRVQDLLGQALSVALNSMPNDRSVAEARTHMRQALNKIDHVQEKEKKKRKSMTQTNHESWWNNVQAGTSELAASNFTVEAHQKSLSQLNAMIEDEKHKLQELEKHSDVQPDQTDHLLRD